MQTKDRGQNKAAMTIARVALAFLLGAILTLPVAIDHAMAASSKIYDHEQRRWVEYTPSRAQKFYRRHNQTPDTFRRQVVKFRTAEKPGTIIIDSDSKFLYLVLDDFKAIRYGVGVGREASDGQGSWKWGARRNGRHGHRRKR